MSGMRPSAAMATRLTGSRPIRCNRAELVNRGRAGRFLMEISPRSTMLLQNQRSGDADPNKNRLLASLEREDYDALTLQAEVVKLKFSMRSEEHTSELQSLRHLVCRLLLEKKK